MIRRPLIQSRQLQSVNYIDSCTTNKYRYIVQTLVLITNLNRHKFIYECSTHFILPVVNKNCQKQHCLVAMLLSRYWICKNLMTKHIGQTLANMQCMQTVRVIIILHLPLCLHCALCMLFKIFI